MRGRLHHVEMYVADLAKSLEFWGWLLEWLGYESHQVWDEGRSWKLGDNYLVFVQTGAGHPDTHDRRGVGLNHLAFHADSRAEVDELAGMLRKRSVRLLYADRYPMDEWYAIYFEDPDGLKIEFVAPST